MTVDQANLVKVYLGHVPLQSFFKHYFHLLFLTLWKTRVKNREGIIPRFRVPSAFQRLFQLGAGDGVTPLAAGPSPLGPGGAGGRW